MTQKEFNERMDAYLASLGSLEPSSWSSEAREWAESIGLVAGDSQGNKMYKKPITREEIAQILYRLHNKNML